MKRQDNKVGLIIIVVLVAMILIGGVIFMVRTIVGGSHSGKQTKQATTETIDLLSEPTADTTIDIRVRGPVVARENHYDIDITVTNSSRLVRIYQGYGRSNVVKEVSLGNDQSSFNAYLKALKNRGFTKQSDKTPNEKSDGICPKGQLIDYIARDGDQVKSELWTTSCNDVQGTFGGSSQGVIDLTLAQIPGAKAAIDEIENKLNGQVDY